MVAGIATMKRFRLWLLSFLYFTPVIGEMININYYSMETYRGPDRGFEVNLTDLMVWGIVLGLLVKERKKLTWLPFNSVPLFLFFLACISSTVVAPLKLVSLFTLWKFAKLYLVYWCIYNLLSPKMGISFNQVAYGMIGIGYVMLYFALKQKYLEGYYRIHGPFDHSNTIPIFLFQMIPVLMLWAITDRRVPRWQSALALLSAFGATFAIVATQSRAGAILIGCAIVAILGFANIRNRSKRSIVVSLIFALVAVAGIAKAADTFIDRFKNAPKASEEARDEFNHAARLMMADKPFTGVGLNNFSRVLTVETKYNSHIVVMANEEQAGVAHHIYLLTGAEMGYTGLFLYLLCMGRFWFLALYYGLRFRTVESVYLIGFFIGFGCFHVVGFLEWAFRISPVTYFVAVNSGVIAALAERVKQGQAKELP
jgi:O-antigen ligase